jgi:hypothetical protein
MMLLICCFNAVGAVLEQFWSMCRELVQCGTETLQDLQQMTALGLGVSYLVVS